MRTNTLIAPVELTDRRPAVNGRGITPAVAEPARKSTSTATVLVGFDWGTNKSCIQVSEPGSDAITSTVTPTIVG